MEFVWGRYSGLFILAQEAYFFVGLGILFVVGSFSSCFNIFVSCRPVITLEKKSCSETFR